jgi:hypothetical protein
MQYQVSSLEAFTFNTQAYLQTAEKEIPTIKVGDFFNFLLVDRMLLRRLGIFENMGCEETQREGNLPLYDAFRDEVSIIFASACARQELIETILALPLPYLTPFILNIENFIKNDHAAAFSLFFSHKKPEVFKERLLAKYDLEFERMLATYNALKIVKVVHYEEVCTPQELYDAAIFYKKMNMLRYVLKEKVTQSGAHYIDDYSRLPYNSQKRPLFQVCSADYNSEENYSAKDPHGEELFDYLCIHLSSHVAEIFISTTCLSSAVKAGNEVLTRIILHRLGQDRKIDTIEADVGGGKTAFAFAIQRRMSLETIKVFFSRAVVYNAVQREIDALEEGEYKSTILEFQRMKKEGRL